MERFIVVSLDEAQEQGFPEAAGYRYFCWMLYETDGKKPIRLVGTDGGEPEDQLLIRDWKWVPEEFNRMAKELDSLRSFKASVDYALNSGDGTYRP